MLCLSVRCEQVDEEYLLQQMGLHNHPDEVSDVSDTHLMEHTSEFGRVELESVQHTLGGEAELRMLSKV